MVIKKKNINLKKTLFMLSNYKEKKAKKHVLMRVKGELLKLTQH